MKKNEVQVGASYVAKVSGKLAEVRITGESKYGGWDAVNVATKKAVRIKSAQRLRAAANGQTRKAARSDNPLLKAAGGQFTDALNAASVAQLEEALALGVPARNAGRIRAALDLRRRGDAAIADGQKAAAEGVARTVEAVERGDLARGVEVPMPVRRAHGKRLKQAGGQDAAPAAPVGPRAAEAPKATGDARPAAGRPTGKMSGLDAAARVLAEAGEPLNARQIVEQAAAKGYWSSDAATPHATIYAAMLIECRKKGDAARFVKADRGLWTVSAAGKQAK